MTRQTGLPLGLKKLIPESIRRELRFPLRQRLNRIRFWFKLLANDTDPLVHNWYDRGPLIHRFYVEQYIAEHREDIHGHCLEFQDDHYLSKFDNGRVLRREILHHAPGNPQATLVADLTQPNAIPSNSFDCIICTYVLHIVPEAEKMVADLYRILKPGGVLLVAVPNITVHYAEFDELWRFTEKGLHYLLARSFQPDQVSVRSYGNAITAIRELYGLGVSGCRQQLLSQQDSRYTLVVCARAVK